MAELLQLAKISGIDPEQLPKCLAGGMADSVILQRVFSQMRDRDFKPPRGQAKQLNEDLAAVGKFSRAHELDLPALDAAIARYGEFSRSASADTDSADTDSAAISLWYENLRPTIK